MKLRGVHMRKAEKMKFAEENCKRHIDKKGKTGFEKIMHALH